MILLYFTGIKMPRTMFVSGWFCMLVLLFSSRLIRSYFYKTYKVVPLKTYDSQLDNIAKNLTTLAQQDGWVGVIRDRAPIFHDIIFFTLVDNNDRNCSL